MKTIAMLASLAFATGCGSGTETPDLVVDDVNVIIESNASIVSDPNLGERLENIMKAVSMYAGGTMDQLSGLTIILVDSPFVCPSPSGTCEGTLKGRTITINVNYHPECIENSVLAHEIFHVFIQDECHTDPRWNVLTWQLYGLMLFDIDSGRDLIDCQVIPGYQAYDQSC